MLDKKLFFDHIYKAGGSSIDQVLKGMVEPAHITDMIYGNYRDAVSTWRSKKVITGHFSFFPGDALDPDRYHFTMLRHPVDRILSHYYFARNNVAGAPNAQTNLAKTLDLESFVFSEKSAVTEIISNGQTYHFNPSSPFFG